MTYCLAIRTESGIVFAADSRTNAGVDHISTYSKMSIFELPGRLFVLLSAGNLATTQAVVNRVQRDLEEPETTLNLGTVKHLLDAARYIGKLSVAAQEEHAGALEKSGINPECSFILGGRIDGAPHDVHLIYPQGNSITASPTTPYLQIGEIKYGKPILDRVTQADMRLGQAAKLVLLSFNSTLRSNLSVGMPIDMLLYNTDSFSAHRQTRIREDDPYFADLSRMWSEKLRDAVAEIPDFEI